MKRIAIYLFLSLFLSSLYAQLNLGHEVIASSGGDLSSGGLSFSTTVGEQITTTSVSGNLVLTQGFQQGPQALANSLEEWERLLIDYQVFPIPTADVLNVTIHKRLETPLRVEMTDLSGRRLLGKDLNFFHSGSDNGQIKTADLSPGTYLLLIKDERGAVMHTVKVAKR